MKDRQNYSRHRWEAKVARTKYIFYRYVPRAIARKDWIVWKNPK
jgi:hypothetical protein